MNFDNPQLRAVFEENKPHLEQRLKRLEEIDRDISQMEANLKSLETPPGKQSIDDLGTIIWNGERIKLDKRNLLQCPTEIKLKAAPFLIDFLTFILKGSD